MQNLENTVRLINNIKFKIEANEEFKQAYNKQLAFEFNAFNFFKIGENKISEILSFFLNPRESHGQGDVFLNEFTKQFLHEEYDLKNASIVCERIIDHNRRVDIFIELKNKVIVIENKIWAKDQYNQLCDYSSYLHKKTNGNYLLLYLNPFGTDPNSNSIEKELLDELNLHKRFKIISYETDVFELVENWLKKCEADNVTYFLRQFKIYLQTKFLGNKTLDMTKNIEDLIYANENEVNALVNVYNELDKMILAKLNTISNNLINNHEFCSYDGILIEPCGPFPWEGMRVFKFKVTRESNSIWVEIVKDKISLRITHYFDEENNWALDHSELAEIELNRETSNEEITKSFLNQVSIAAKVLQKYNQE